MPRLNVQLLRYGDSGKNTAGIGVYLGHYSNGQTDDLFTLEDGTSAPDGSFTLEDLESGSVKTNTTTGNFSLHYIRVAFDLSSYRNRAGFRITGGFEWSPQDWMFESLRDNIYPPWRFPFSVGAAIPRFCQRFDAFSKGTVYKYKGVFRRICGQIEVLLKRCGWVETGRRGDGIRPSLRSERVYHARSVPAVNPLRGSCVALRSFG